MLNFLNIRLIVNGKDIYTLPKNRSILIPLSENHPSLVATDGFHITEPLNLVLENNNIRNLTVGCVIDNNLLVTGFVLLLIFSTVGIVSNLILFQVLSFLPIVLFLAAYYTYKNKFLLITTYSE